MNNTRRILKFSLSQHVASTMVVTLAIAVPALGEPSRVEKCVACSPEVLVDNAEAAMREAMTLQLKQGEVPKDLPAQYIVAAEEAAALGRDADAIPFAQHAAAECVLRGDDGCGATIAMLAELTLNERPDDEASEDAALAYLSLLPYESLGWRTCTEAVVLRYRLAERRSPRLAQAGWADRCGPVGRTDEAGYRSAKAALLQGDIVDAKERLARLRAFTPKHAVRSTYLYAVALVAAGELDEAAEAFDTITAISPSEYRGENEDDARILAHIQRARLYREAGDHTAALDAYRKVPALSWQRSEALLEAAVTAGNDGDLGAARNYLNALDRYEPEMKNLLQMYQVKANLNIIDENEADAVLAFQKLAAIGRRVRAETFGESAPPFEEQLQSDPSLGGLLDPKETQRLTTLEAEVARLGRLIDENREATKLIRKAIDDGAPRGPIFRALETLREADLLLQRAENVQAQKEKRGVRYAQTGALSTFRRAQRVRRELDAATQKLLRAQRKKQARVLTILNDLEEDRALSEEVLADLTTETSTLASERRVKLREKAERVVHGLEMAEDVGILEFKFYRKNKMTKQREAFDKEMAQEKKTLSIDGEN